ncbi:MAG: hypothetical protein OEV43_00290 [Coriobacteriia bacterium]|nr:hypothetical protein [Coriobacteriia bacterium]
MVRARPVLPHGHGELLTDPPFDEWAAIADENAARSSAWDFTVGGVSAAELRQQARREAVTGAEEFSARLGVPTRSVPAEPGRVVLTGHQPQLYHPGVWIKNFLLQRFADETGAAGIDLVVDSDAFESVSLTMPCLAPEVRRCSEPLATGGPNRCFACTDSQDRAAVERFCSVVDGLLAGLPAPALRRHFGEFGTALLSAVEDARNLGELVTFARRRYERVAGTDYAELPVTRLGRTEAFARFVSDIVVRAEEFAACYNSELGRYRRANRIRTAAQPFPDLSVESAETELPFWAMGATSRGALSVARHGDTVVLLSDGAPLFEVPAQADAVADALHDANVMLAPKALTLTLFARLFVADLFIHGVGGGRYDRVTDGVMRDFYGIEAPRYVVASMTMYLPLGGHIVTDEELAEARRRLQRLEHNPDSLLGEVDFETTEDRREAFELAEEKTQLVAEIAEAQADKKRLGSRIREVNRQLADLLGPLADQLSTDLATLEAQRAATEILTDREYPFCLWSPLEVADKAR